MRKRALAVVIGLLAAGAVIAPVRAHESDVMTPGGKVGPIQTGETTVREMKDLFGEPRSKTVKRVGCSKVLQLRWDKIQTFSYRSERIVVDVRVRSDRVPSEEGVLRFHTRRGLRVGDSEARLRELYPKRKPMTHPKGGHVHYKLGGEYEKLLAKVVDETVVELEAAPYEFC
jgi:hypothetical protein